MQEEQARSDLIWREAQQFGRGTPIRVNLRPVEIGAGGKGDGVVGRELVGLEVEDVGSEELA